MPDWKKIQSYALAWNLKDHFGSIRLKLDDQSKPTLKVDSAAELSAAADLLRNGYSPSYDSESKSIRTGWEVRDDIP